LSINAVLHLERFQRLLAEDEVFPGFPGAVHLFWLVVEDWSG
jgi:hypothetical protein